MKNEMKTIDDRICRPGQAPGKPAALLGCLVLALTVPGTGLKAQVPDISKAALLSWPEPTEEQIVVGATNLLTGAVWTPWPEPIFKRFGQMCMTVPTTASQQYFKLAPGRQFLDDFGNGWGPFTNRDSYMDFVKDPGEEWFVTNGALKLQSAYSGFLLVPLGTNAAAKHEDFFTSADILDWVTSGTNWSLFSIAGRIVILSPTAGIGYGGGLALNADGIAGNVQLTIFHEWHQVWGPTFDMGTNPPPYRLELSGVGNPICRLRLRVLSLTTKALIAEQTLLATEITSGVPAIWVNKPIQAGDTLAITVDNYFVTGTKQ